MINNSGLLFERIPLKHVHTLPYIKQMISASLRHETGHAKLVFWDSPKGRGWGER